MCRVQKMRDQVVPYITDSKLPTTNVEAERDRFSTRDLGLCGPLTIIRVRLSAIDLAPLRRTI